MKYWVAVNGNLDIAPDKKTKFWWCLPFDACSEDLVLLYRPRSVSAKHCGFFGLSKVIVAPKSKCEKNIYCNGYGMGKKPIYGYAEVEAISFFTKNMTIAYMKTSTLMSELNILRKNFQGTTFELTEQEYYLIVNEITRLNAV